MRKRSRAYFGSSVLGVSVTGLGFNPGLGLSGCRVQGFRAGAVYILLYSTW